MSDTKVLLSEMTRVEVQAAIDRGAVALIAVGSTEQHGPHLPVDTDMRIAYAFCEQAARKVAAEVPVVLTPSLPFGISGHHVAWPGLMSLEPETFIAALHEVCRSLVRQGFERLVIVNGHGGNEGAIGLVAQKLKLDDGAKHVYYCSEWALAHPAFTPVRETEPGDSHAGEYETSVYLHLREDLVDASAYVSETFASKVDGDVQDLFAPGFYGSAVGSDFSRSGVEGDATLATREKGRIACEGGVERLARLLSGVAALS
jgi:creatinine amidohydrolase